MAFYRFEGMKSYRFNPRLSTADGPVIEGEKWAAVKWFRQGPHR